MNLFSRIVITMVLAVLSSHYAVAYHNISPYAWCGGNPILCTDKTGKDYGVTVFNDSIEISANFYTPMTDIESAQYGCELINCNNGSYYAQIETEDGIVEIPISFNAQAIETDIFKISSTAQADNIGNAYFIKPDTSFDSNVNGKTVGGNNVNVKYSRAMTSTVGHEFGHAMGATHHGGIMSATSSERYNNNLDTPTVNQMFKKAINGVRVTDTGKGYFNNTSNYSDKQLKKAKIIFKKK